MSEDIDPHVLRKYEILQRLGRGAYGIVWKAVSRKNNQIVALKKCFDAFQNSTDAQRTFREIMYLQELRGHENIVEILNVIRSENDRDIYIITDFLESDLHAVIKAGILQDIHKQYILYQIVRALKYMHSGELVHRDLKPSNILLNADCLVKLCDFGLARSVAANTDVSQDSNSSFLSEYIATRWFRSPELLLAYPLYSKGVDIWAVGCILGEMLTGKPVFPGTSTLDQLERVLTVTGPPSKEDLDAIQSPFAETMLQSINPRQDQRSLADMFPKASPDMLDFLKRCFRFNPNKRPSAIDLLQHPLFSRFHDSKKEPSAPTAIRIALDDNIKLSADDYRKHIYQLIMKRASREQPEPPILVNTAPVAKVVVARPGAYMYRTGSSMMAQSTAKAASLATYTSSVGRATRATKPVESRVVKNDPVVTKNATKSDSTSSTYGYEGFLNYLFGGKW
jgi:mitogen-activated protein kinase 15